MRHGMNGRKLSRTSAHRKSLLMNLARSLILHDRIQTTLAKAKDLRPYVEKLVTVARQDNLANKRFLLAKFMGDLSVVNRLLTVVAPRCVTRNGGYVRILKNGFRKGDNAPIGLIEFVDAVLPVSASKDTTKEQKRIENNVTEDSTVAATSAS